MTIEQALISQARPQMVAAKARELIRHEISKGCRPQISHVPVSLEPLFNPLWVSDNRLDVQSTEHWKEETQIAFDEPVRLQIWISPDLKLDWIRAELFIKQLQSLSYRVGFEVAGNSKGIFLNFVCHPSALPVLTAAFNGEFEICVLTSMNGQDFWGNYCHEGVNLVFRDFFPPPPYSHLLTRPPELYFSSLQPLITSISAINEPAVHTENYSRAHAGKGICLTSSKLTQILMGQTKAYIVFTGLGYQIFQRVGHKHMCLITMNVELLSILNMNTATAKSG